MTSVYIAGAVIVLLMTAVCYAFFVHTVSKKKLQQEKLVQTLEQRIKNFRYLLSGFPEGYLPKDMLLLLYNQLVDAAQQLTSLKPKESRYVDELSSFTRELSDIQRKPPSQKRFRLESAAQGKEIKQYLTELNQFIQRLNSRGKLPKAQMEAHQADIKSLVLNIAVDAYVDQAKESEKTGKPRMALHFYTLARNLLDKEKVNASHKELKAELDRQVIRLTELAGTGVKSQDSEPTEDTSSKDWNKFNGDDGWKKKAVYD